MKANEKQTPLNRSAIASTHVDVEKMLFKLAWGAQHRWGGEWDEWESSAAVGYLIAFRSFDPGRGASFITWCWWSVVYQLRAHQERRCRNRLRTNTLHDHEDDDRDNINAAAIPDRPKSFLALLVEDLSEDARTIVQLVVDTPGELVELLRQQDHTKKTGISPEARSRRMKVRRKRVLVDYLKRSGWSLGRIVSGFDEIQEAIA